MSYSSSPNLVLELHRPWLRYLPALLLLCAALGLPWLASAWSPLTRALFVAITAGLALLSLWRTGFGRPHAQLVRLSWDQTQHWQWLCGSGVSVSATLLSHSWCSPWVICLKFRTDMGGTRQLLLWRGEVSAIEWHQWQLRLRLEAGRTTAAQDMGPAS